MSGKAVMALFDERHRINLSGGWYLEKQDDNQWQIGGPCGDITCLLGMHITGNVPVGVGGSMDSEVKKFAEAMNDGMDRAAAALWRAENPDKSVFACNADEKERYRQRIRVNGQ